MKLVIPSMLALLGSASLASAAISFTENFNSGNAGPNLTLGTGFGTPTTTFAGNNFTITSLDNHRIYLGTNGTSGTDYYNVDFVFQATVTVPNSSSAWAIAFIGMGNPNATGASGEPGSPNFGMAVRNDGTDYLEGRDNGAGSGTNRGEVPVVDNGTHGLRMTWNATTKSALFEYDADNNGVFETNFTLTGGGDNGFDSTNSRLYVGGGAGLSFDNISVTVVPEPSAALLGGLGVLALLRRRR